MALMGMIQDQPNQIADVSAPIRDRLQASVNMNDSVSTVPSVPQPKPVDQNPFLGGAIDSRMRRLYEGQLADLNLKQQIDEPKRQFERSSERLQTSMARQKLEFMKEYNEKLRKMQDDALRAQTLGSILGVAGMAAGMYFGGPAGGAAGAQIGGQIGQNMGKV